VKFTSRDDCGKIFENFHNPERPIYQIAHAKRPNSSENYNSESFLKAAERMRSRAIDGTKVVLNNFANSKKK
jgi:hypothetical protein